MTDEERGRRMIKALEYGGPTHRLSDVVELIEAGRAQFWQNDEGAIVTEIHDFPLLKAVHFWLISGELKHCLALEHDILPWAIERGCTVATACGRKGWGRAAAPTGWRPWFPSFWKPLVEGVEHGRLLR